MMISIAAKSSIDQTKSGRRIHVIPGARRLWIVTRKLIAPASDDSVRTWIDRIQKSTPFPACCVQSGG